MDEPTLENRSPFHHGRAHEDHAVARDGGRRRVVDVVNLEENLGVGCHRNAIAVRQCQRLVVVQHRVQVLDPDGVNRSVKNQPHIIRCKHNQTIHVHCDLRNERPVLLVTNFS